MGSLTKCRGLDELGQPVVIVVKGDDVNEQLRQFELLGEGTPDLGVVGSEELPLRPKLSRHIGVRVA